MSPAPCVASACARSAAVAGTRSAGGSSSPAAASRAATHWSRSTVRRSPSSPTTAARPRQAKGSGSDARRAPRPGVSAAVRRRRFSPRRHAPGAPLVPPFHAIRVTGARSRTLGGLAVDGAAHVLDGEGRPIVGLYAAGGAAVGLAGTGSDGALAGIDALAALALGRLAAL